MLVHPSRGPSSSLESICCRPRTEPRTRVCERWLLSWRCRCYTCATALTSRAQICRRSSRGAKEAGLELLLSDYKSAGALLVSLQTLSLIGFNVTDAVQALTPLMELHKLDLSHCSDITGALAPLVRHKRWTHKLLLWHHVCRRWLFAQA
jgi:hypothetical protein